MTVDSPENGRTTGQRLQYGLRGLMVLAFAAAVGFSTIGTENARWFHVLMAAALALVILGLIHQVCDLWRTFRGRDDLSANQRWGWRFAVFWRIAVGLLMAGYYSVTILLEREVIALPDGDSDLFYAGSTLRDAVAMLAALIVLGSIPRPAPKRLRWWWRSRWIGTLGILGGACWCWLVWWDQLLIHFLVNEAVQGMGRSAPLWLSTEGFGYVPAARVHAFLCYSLLGAAGMLVSLCSIYRLARPRRQGFRPRWVTVGFLLCGLLAVGSYVIWLGTSGLRRISMMSAQLWGSSEPLHVWISALLMVTVFVTAATYRMSAIGDGDGHGLQANWRRRPKAYYHERHSVVLLVGTGFVGLLMPRFSWTWQDFFYATVGSPQSMLPVAVFLVAMQKLLTGWSRSAEPAPAAVPELPLARFCTVWIALLLTVILAVPTIAGLAFAVWLSPWYRLPLP